LAESRVLITGGGGQLACALRARWEERGQAERITSLSRAELDITGRDGVRACLNSLRPGWIVNCAAFTAVDAAEDDPAAAFRVNDEAVGVLADSAEEYGARLVHVSTDYVFDGQKPAPYVEEDATHPINVYGASKLAGEERLRRHPVRSAVLRTAWLFGERARNFVSWFLGAAKTAAGEGRPLPVVDDQVGSPTDVHTVAEQIETVIDEEMLGLYHAAAVGSASWFEFAQEIVRQMELAVQLRPIAGAQLGRAARRAGKVVLENRRLNSMGRSRMIPWQDGLRRVVDRLGPQGGLFRA